MDRYTRLAELVAAVIAANDAGEEQSVVCDRADDAFVFGLQHFLPDYDDPELLQHSREMWETRVSGSKLAIADAMDADTLRTIYPGVVLMYVLANLLRTGARLNTRTIPSFQYISGVIKILVLGSNPLNEIERHTGKAEIKSVKAWLSSRETA